MEKTHLIKACQPETRLSDYCFELFVEIPSKKAIKKAIKSGQITLNHKKTHGGDYVKAGDTITLTLKQKPVFEHALEIIFEDDEIAVIDKPSGLIVSGNTFRTVENALPFNLKESTSSDKLIQPLPAHRLDFPTRGLLLVAKTNRALIQLKADFEEKKITKIYHAITIGDMPKSGKINEPLLEKEALTNFKVIQKKSSPKYTSINLVQLQPITGRQHQIRKHLAFIGHPILGDRDYGTEAVWDMHKGLYLHASEIAFFHPITNEPLHFKSDLPRKFSKLIK